MTMLLIHIVHFAENSILKALNELQEHQIRMTATASITLKDRLKNVRKAILKASQDQAGATLKYSLPCIEQLCKHHHCPEEYTRVVALLGDTPIDAVHPRVDNIRTRQLAHGLYQRSAIRASVPQSTAQDTKIIDDCVDSTFMLPAAKETSAPSQAEESTKSDIIERKCIIQMKATVTEEKMPTTKRPKKETKATKDINLFWSHAHGSLAYALFPDGYVGHENAPYNRVSAIGCNYPNCSCTPESQLCKLKCGHTACSQCIVLKPAFTNDPMQTVGGSKKPRRSVGCS